MAIDHRTCIQDDNDTGNQPKIQFLNSLVAQVASFLSFLDRSILLFSHSRDLDSIRISLRLFSGSLKRGVSFNRVGYIPYSHIDPPRNSRDPDRWWKPLGPVLRC